LGCSAKKVAAGAMLAAARAMLAAAARVMAAAARASAVAEALGKLRLCLRGHRRSPLARSRRCLLAPHRHLAPGWEIGNVR
jgi:hypothetical protein